jgi:hypothetical protein
VTATREELLRFADCCDAAEIWHAAHSARLAASKLAPPAPDDAPRFRVGDDVIVALDENDRERGKVVALLSGDLLVRVGDCRVWRSPSEVTPTDAPDDEGLSDVDAMAVGAFEANDVLSSSDEMELKGIARRIRTALANGAGEVERLRNTQATIARVARQRDSEEAGRLEALAERDALRAELDEARRERDEARDERDVLRAYDTAAHVSSGLAATIADRDRLRKQLDDTERVLATCRSDWDAWRDWAEARLPMVEWHSDREARALIDAKLAAAKAGPVVTAEDVRVIHRSMRYLAWHSPDFRELRSLADRLAAFIQSRGETEAGK